MTYQLDQIDVELLAPVGRWDVLEAVIEAGANAVYLGGKKYNMRMFRDDYNFTNESLMEAISYAHTRGVKVYVTLNNLQSDEELKDQEAFLTFLETAQPDSLIVQDLGVLKLARDMGLTVPLHASVMMNTHNLAGLQFLKRHGVTRVVLNREIPFGQIRHLRDASGMELEYFIHGDMCIAQSGQCYASGLLFGQSSNRGRCMKPCRWAYELGDAATGEKLATGATGPYFLALNDMCMLYHIPELIQSGICSFKIEGRMREASYLSRIVSTYRKAIDQYVADPTGYRLDKSLRDEMQDGRIRDLTTCYTFKHPGPQGIDYSGQREPQFFSTGVRELSLDRRLVEKNPLAKLVEGQEQGDKPLLSVRVATLTALRKALAAGADRVYFGGETPADIDFIWSKANLAEAFRLLTESDTPGILSTPRITMEREMAEYRSLFQWLEGQQDPPLAGVMVGNFGMLELAKNELSVPIYGDYSLNVLNSQAVQLLQENELVQVAVSPECSFARLKQLAETSALPMEALVHGSLTSMVLEHCLAASLLDGKTREDICSEHCRDRRFVLQDSKGQSHQIIMDQYCRNHVLLANDLCMLPFLESFLRLGLGSLRLDVQFYPDELVDSIVRSYREALDGFYAGNALTPEILYETIVSTSQRPLGLGAYPRGITGLR